MKKEKSPLLSRLSRRAPLLLSFFMPFFIVSICYAVAGVFPFGDRMILASDGWHQYYPFLLTLRQKLVNGESFEYVRNMGMGSNYLSIFAYYVASPLNLLSVLVPADYMRDFFTLATVLKLSFAGLFFGIFLRVAYRRSEISQAFFALAYALCAWAAGYYWNIMWLDVFALLPLLMAGTVSLLRDGRFRLYIAALALSLWSNYYVAFFCCIFVLLSFIGYCIICFNGFGNLLRRFVRIGVCTLIGAGIAAALLIPTLQAMQITVSAKEEEVLLLSMNLPKIVNFHPELMGWGATLKEKVLPAFGEAMMQIGSRFVPGHQPTFLEGLPNVFCGFSMVILAIFYFFNGKIKLREKIFNLSLLFFLLISFIFRVLDYVWHGFHFPNMLPYRFSFLVPFVIICMAYRAYTLMENFKYWKVFFVLPIAFVFFACGYIVGNGAKTVWVSAAVVLVGMLIFFVLHGQRARVRRPRVRYARIFLCVLILCEMVLSFSLGLDRIGTTSRNTYPEKNTQVQALLDYAEENDNDLFYRTEMTDTQTLNDGALNGYYGLSVFNSSANVNFNRFSRALGFASWPGSNRYAYYEGSPFANTLAGLKYLIDRDGQHLSSRNTLAAISGDVLLLENSSYLGLGFMTDLNFASFLSREAQKNPLLDQEEMFRLATGIESRLYRHVDYSTLTAEDEECTLVKSTNRTTFRYTKPESLSKAFYTIDFEMDESGLLLMQAYMVGSGDMKVYRNGKLLISRPVKVRSLFCLGDVEAGDTISFTFEAKDYSSGSISLDVALQNDGIYDMGMEHLADEVWNLTHAEDTYYRGTIAVKQDGLFYTSIPYEPGWTAYVDGKQVELAQTYDPKNADVLLTDAVISFPLGAGSHIIELKYSAPGLGVGLLISVLSALLFVALCVLLRKEPVLWKDVIRELPAGKPEDGANADVSAEDEEFNALLEHWTQGAEIPDAQEEPETEQMPAETSDMEEVSAQEETEAVCAEETDSEEEQPSADMQQESEEEKEDEPANG